MAEDASEGVEVCDFNGSKVPLPIDLIESVSQYNVQLKWLIYWECLFWRF